MSPYLISDNFLSRVGQWWLLWHVIYRLYCTLCENVYTRRVCAPANLAWCVELWERWYYSQGYFYPWLSFVSCSIKQSSYTFADTEPRLSSEERLATSHQLVSLSALLKQRVGGVCNWPIFTCQFGTHQEALGARVWIFLVRADCSGSTEIVVHSPSKCFLHFFKGPPEDRNRPDLTLPHDLWVTSLSEGEIKWSSDVVVEVFWDSGPGAWVGA